MELSSLLAAAAEIRDAQQAGENTADRVGTLLVNIIAALCRTLPAAGITLKADAAGTGITVSYYTDEGTPVKRNVILPVATNSQAGVMSAADKAKLDAAKGALATKDYADDYDLGTLSVSSGQNNVGIELENEGGTTLNATIPAATNSQAGVMTSADKNLLGNVVASIEGVSVTKSGTAVSIDFEANQEGLQGSATIGAATSSHAGVMSASDKAKLDAANGALATQGYANTAAANATKDSLTKSGFTLVHDLAGNYYNKNITATATSAAFELKTGNDTTAKMTIPAATSSSAGLMSAADKVELGKAANTGKSEALKSLFQSLGARYNDETGYYELNGIKNLTQVQMLIIASLPDSNGLDEAKPTACTLFNKPRTNKPQLREYYNENYVRNWNGYEAFYGSHNIEQVALFGMSHVGTSSQQTETPEALLTYPVRLMSGTAVRTFQASALTKVWNVIDVSQVTSFTSFVGVKLEYIRIRGLKCSLTLTSDNLSYDSAEYLVNNLGTPVSGTPSIIVTETAANKWGSGQLESLAAIANEKGFSLGVSTH